MAYMAEHSTPSHPRTGRLTVAVMLLSLGTMCLHFASQTFAQAHNHSGASETADGDEMWQVIHLQGQRVGYLHGRSWTTSVEGETHHWSESVTRMTIKRFGGTLTMTVRQSTEEDTNGNLLGFTCEVDNPPLNRTTTTGRIIDGDLRLTIDTDGKTTDLSKPWDPEVKSPAYQDRNLAEHPLQPGETRSFRIYDPQMGDFARLDLRGEPPAETRMFDGSLQSLPWVSVHHSLLPLVNIKAYLNADGETVKTEMGLLGMESFAVSREEALRTIEGAELDLAVNTLLPVERISDPHQTRRVVYHITAAHPRIVELFPTGSTQKVTPVDEDTIRLEVERFVPRESQTDAGVDGEYLQKSRFLDTADPRVIALADTERTSPDDLTAVAVALEKTVHQQIRQKNFSTALATASEVARQLEGDCTEHAMLLAALLRVRGIPSRVAVGLVYAEPHSAFAGHMWTEAFLEGQWIPLDATLGQGGIGGAHIKVADSSMSDEGPEPVMAFLPLVECLGRIKIDVQSAE